MKKYNARKKCNLSINAFLWKKRNDCQKKRKTLSNVYQHKNVLCIPILNMT